MDNTFLLIVYVNFVSYCKSQQVNCYYCSSVTNTDQCYSYTQSCVGECLDQIKTHHATGQQTYTKGCVSSCSPGEKNDPALEYKRNDACCKTSKCNKPTRGMTKLLDAPLWSAIVITTAIALILIVIVLSLLCSGKIICSRMWTKRPTPWSRSSLNGNTRTESHAIQVSDPPDIPVPTAPVYTIHDSNPPPSYEDTVGNNDNHNWNINQSIHHPSYEG